MDKKNEALDAAFVDAQRQRLLRLKTELATTSRDRHSEIESATQAVNGQAREFEDDAQHLTELELSGQLDESVERRLSAIDHALTKIAAGTYGKSDLSGRPIGRERLEALPEASLTRQEQQDKDAEQG